VADTVYVWIVHRFERAHRYLLTRAGQSRMDRNYNKIQLSKKFIFEIQRTIGMNVNLTAGKDCDAFDLFVEFADFFYLPG
jgi:hypothetical protein